MTFTCVFFQTFIRDRETIATPNARVGEQTPGTAVFKRFREQLESLRKQMYEKKREVCSYTRQINALVVSKKEAAACVAKLVRP